MLIRDVMDDDQVVVAPTTPVPEILKQLLDTNHDAAAVVDEQGVFLGVIGLRDVLRRIVPVHLYMDPNLSNVVHEGYFEERFGRLHSAVAQELMDPLIATVHADDTIIRAVALIVENKRKTIPVLDDKRHLLGMVTRQSLLKHVVNSYKERERET